MAFIHNAEVSSHDTDINGFARPSSVLRYLQDAANKNFSEKGLSYSELLKNNLSFIVSRAAIKILSPLNTDEKLTVETWATKNSGVIFPRSYRIKANNETVVESVMQWALIDTNTKSFVKGSDFDISHLGTDEVLELDMPSRFKIPKDLPLNFVGTKEVRYSDIDENLHMNNTIYPNVLFDFINDRENLFMSSLLINFVSEAPYGKTIEIYMSEKIEENDELIYYFRTMIDGKTNIESLMKVRHV